MSHERDTNNHTAQVKLRKNWELRQSHPPKAARTRFVHLPPNPSSTKFHKNVEDGFECGTSDFQGTSCLRTPGISLIPREQACRE